MKKFKRLLQIIQAIGICIEGYIFKYLVDLRILKIPNILDSDNNIIVSLTSHGRRVKNNVVYYTICSLLRQRLKPGKIILCLDETKWNDNNIPTKLLSLKEKGVDFLFCEDVRSYTKLVPTLLKYPESTIITVDDDSIYPYNTIEQLVDEHNKNPHDIICLYAEKPIISNGGIPHNYKAWSVLKKYESGKNVFPIGAAGVLYPSHSLHSDVSNKELFLKLCPLADDIWFWFCSLRNNTNRIFVPSKNEALSFDMLYQYIHKGSALTHANKHLSKNDEQLLNIFNYFNVYINENGDLCKK